MEKISIHTLTLEREGSNSFLRNIFRQYFILEISQSSGLAGITFHLHLEGKKRIRMSCFSVTDPFLTTSYYVEKRNGILRKNRGEEFEKSYIPLHGGRGVKNFQNHPYVINEWPLRYCLYFCVLTRMLDFPEARNIENI